MRFLSLFITALIAVCLLPILMVTAANPTINPGENLVLKGVPAIPTNLAETVNRYTQFRSANLVSWHPTHREMLISTRFADTPQIHLVKSPLATRQQLTFFPEPISSATFQPTQGDYFVFSKDEGGNEFNQNYRYDFASGEITLLTDGKSKNSLGVWSNRGDRMIYTSTRRNGKNRDFYIIEPKNPQSDAFGGRSHRLLATVEENSWSALDWSVDDKQLLALEFVSANESYLWLIDIQSGEKKLITPKDNKEKIAYRQGVFSRDNKGIYVVTDRDSEFSRLAYLDLSTFKHTYLTTNIPWDVEELDLSQDGKYIAFVTNEDGISVLHLLDTKTGQEKPLPKLPVGQIYRINWHKNNRDLGFSLVTARSTPDIYSFNLATNQITRWTASETGGLNPTNWSEAALVKWQSFDGKMISGFLYRPPAKFKGKRPVIINIHGGPESQSIPTFLGSANYYLNELGMAILYPNVRGSSGYGKTFLTLDNGYQREDAVKDIGALLDWIATQPDLDQDRILVTGGSYGGYMSLAVATKYSHRIRASINIVGISNFVTFLEKTESYRRDLRRVEYGDERDPKMREFLLKISPLNSASKIKKPLFVVHGQNDPRVPVNEAEQIVTAVANNNVPVWYLLAKDEGHGFRKKQNIDFQFYATVMFIKEFLLK
jgi:dipeptidyl aminopeptidase/acylaminoacyl peptidase